MGRQIDVVRAVAIYSVVALHPGINLKIVSQIIGMSRPSGIYNTLAAMEKTPLLLAENDRGGLYVLANKALHTNT